MRRKLPQGYRRSGSSNPLSMTAFSRKKDADPLAPIRDGAKQEVKGRANKPTERQKDGAAYILPHQDSITRIREGEGGAMDYADAVLSLPGLALAKPLFKGGKQVVKSIGDTDMGVVAKAVKGIGSLLGKTPDKIKGIAPRSDIKTGEVTSVPKGKVDSPKGRGPFDKDGQLKGAAKQSNLDKVAAGTKKIVEKANQKKIAKNLNKKVGGGKPVPAVRKTTSPAVAPKSRVPAVAPKSKVPANRQAGFNLGSPKGKGSNLKKLIGPALATGAGAYLLSSEKDAKPSAGSQAGGTSVNTSSDGSNAGAGAGMDTDLFDTPTGVTGRKPTGTTGRKPKKDPTEGGKYKSYSKDNNDFMYMTQKGYDEEEEQGDKAGGRPGRGKLKTQGMNKTAKRKAGFSGKGSGAALRGF